MELCIKAERIILRYYFCPEVLLIKEYRGYKPEIMSQFVPVSPSSFVTVGILFISTWFAPSLCR